MERFLKNPHLPKSRVTTLVIGEKYKKTAEYLNALGIKTLTLSENAHLDSEISCHADMLTLHLGENNFVLDAGQKILAEHLTECGANVILQKGIGSPYPNDTILNKLILKGKIYGNFKHTNISNTAFLPENTEKINVNQGYTKCSVCVVSENAVICDDKGIANLLKKSQIDVLEIEKGNIYLSDTHCGFIGGASFKISENLMYFDGNLQEHKNFKEITDFLKKYRVEPVFDASRRLSDIGGAVLLTEQL